MIGRNALILALVGCGLAGAVTVAAPAQDRPGFVTEAHMWIDNRDPRDAIPVTIVEVPEAMQHLSIAPSTVIQTRHAAQEWEYRSVTIAPTQDAALVLAAAGQEGWEATGHQFPVVGGTSILLKRPRMR